MASDDSTMGDAPINKNSQLIDSLINEARNTQAKAQSLISELQEKIREVENKIAKLEIDNQTAQEDVNNARDLPCTSKENKDATNANPVGLEKLVRDFQDDVKNQEATAKFLINALKETLPESKFAAYKPIIKKVLDSQEHARWAVAIILQCVWQLGPQGCLGGVNLQVERDRAIHAFRRFGINLMILQDAFMDATDEANDPVYIGHSQDQL